MPYYAKHTSNESFIRMWRHLQRKRVDNNIFMLTTLDNDLTDFTIEKYLSMDREDPEFQIYRKKVIEEAKNNIWFYFRELLVVRKEIPNRKTEYTHFSLDEGTMMMLYLYKKTSFIYHEPIKGIRYDHNNISYLWFLWNYHRSLNNNDLLITDNIRFCNYLAIPIINDCIYHMSCPMMLGGSQAISESPHHQLNITPFRLDNCDYDHDRLGLEIREKINRINSAPNWLKNERKPSIFFLGGDAPSYHAFPDLFKLIDDGYPVYIDSGNTIPGDDPCRIKYAGNEIYDSKILNPLYVIR